MSEASLLTLSEDLIHVVSLYLTTHELGSLTQVTRSLTHCFSDDKYWMLRFATLVVPTHVHTSEDVTSLPYSLTHTHTSQPQPQLQLQLQPHSLTPTQARYYTTLLASSLNAPNYASLYRSLHSPTHSLTALLGLWGSDPQNLTVNFRGGLLRIRVKEEESKVSE